MSIFAVRLAKASDKLNAASKDGQDVHAHLIAAMEMAQTAQKDMDWRKALEDPVHRQNAIKALKDEVDSLEATILTRILRRTLSSLMQSSMPVLADFCWTSNAHWPTRSGESSKASGKTWSKLMAPDSTIDKAKARAARKLWSKKKKENKKGCGSSSYSTSSYADSFSSSSDSLSDGKKKTSKKKKSKKDADDKLTTKAILLVPFPAAPVHRVCQSIALSSVRSTSFI